MESNTVSIKQLIDRIKRHPMMEGLNDEYIIDYAVDFLRIVGIPESYEEKYAELYIEDYTAKLPDDFIEMIGVRTAKPDNYSGVCQYKPVYYRYATGTFHTSSNKYNKEPFVYKIQNSTIVTSTKEGKIEIAYRALATDDCGFPLMPDNSSFMRAVESYIKLQYFTILFDQGKLHEAILQKAEQDYAWNVGGVATAMRRLTPDKVQSIANIVKAHIIRDKEHQSGYAHTGRNTELVIH